MTAPLHVRELAARTRGDVGSSLDIESGLAALHATARRRRRTEWLATAAAVLAVLGVTAGLVGRQEASVGPADPPTSSTDGPTGTCGAVPVSICPDRSVVVDTGAFTWSVVLPGGFSTEVSTVDAPENVEIVQRGAAGALAVLAGVEPAEPSVSVDGAQELAAWVTARPFLTASVPQETEVSGYPAWRVDVKLKSGIEPTQSMEASCNGMQADCRPVIQQTLAPEHWEVGVWGPKMDGSFTFVDTPGGTVTAFWSWSYDGADSLRSNDALIDEIEITVEPR